MSASRTRIARPIANDGGIYGPHLCVRGSTFRRDKLLGRNLFFLLKVQFSLTLHLDCRQFCICNHCSKTHRKAFLGGREDGVSTHWLLQKTPPKTVLFLLQRVCVSHSMVVSCFLYFSVMKPNAERAKRNHVHSLIFHKKRK